MSTVTKSIALDETLQSTNTALGSLGKDTTLQAIATAIANVGLSNIGNMSSLATTDKTSLVSAINEVVGDVSDLDTDKADKVTGATNGNLAGLNASGNLTDSGWASDKTTTSASGNPISITGLKSNQLAVNPVITFESIQDLHGYSNPWPSGGGKNIAPITLAGLKTLNSSGSWSGNAYTLNGVTYTIVVDNDNNILSIKTSGTSTGVSYLKLTNNVYNFISLGSSVVISGCPSGGDSSTYNITVGVSSNTGRWETDIGNGMVIASVENPDSTARYMFIAVNNSGINTNNLVWYPQIELGSSKTSYVPSSNICPISGYDKIEVLSCGKNLFNQKMSAGSIDVNTGEPTSTAGWMYSTDCIVVKENTDYYFKANGHNTGLRYYDASYNYIGFLGLSTSDRTITTPANCKYLKFTSNISTYSNDMGVNYPASQTSYVPYVKTTSISESLGQTVYGGQEVVRTGKMTVTKKKIRVTWGDGSGAVNLGSYTRKGFTVSDASMVEADRIQAICDKAPYYGNYSSNSLHFYISTDGNLYIFMPNDTDVSATIDVCYILATPIEIQLTPHEISLLKDYAYVSTNGTSIALDYHNGEIATLGDVSQLGETVNEIGNGLFKAIKITRSYGNVTSGTRYSYCITDDYPFINNDSIIGLSHKAAGGSQSYDYNGLVNWVDSNNKIYISYVCQLTQNNVSMEIYILYK